MSVLDWLYTHYVFWLMTLKNYCSVKVCVPKEKFKRKFISAILQQYCIKNIIQTIKKGSQRGSIDKILNLFSIIEIYYIVALIFICPKEISKISKSNNTCDLWFSFNDCGKFYISIHVKHLKKLR